MSSAPPSVSRSQGLKTSFILNMAMTFSISIMSMLIFKVKHKLSQMSTNCVMLSDGSIWARLFCEVLVGPKSRDMRSGAKTKAFVEQAGVNKWLGRVVSLGY